MVPPWLGQAPPLCRRRARHSDARGRARVTAGIPANLMATSAAARLTGWRSPSAATWAARGGRSEKGFGTGLLIELAPASTRWAPGGVPTGSHRRRLLSIMTRSVARARAAVNRPGTGLCNVGPLPLPWRANVGTTTARRWWIYALVRGLWYDSW